MQSNLRYYASGRRSSKLCRIGTSPPLLALLSVCVYALGVQATGWAELPASAQAFLAGVREKTEVLHVISRSRTYHPQNDTFTGKHMILSKSGALMFVDRMTFQATDESQELFDAKKMTHAISFVFDGDATYHQGNQARSLYDEEPYSLDNLKPENWIISTFAGLSNRKLLGQGNPERRGGGSTIYPGLALGPLNHPMINDYTLLLGVSFGYTGFHTWETALSEGIIREVEQDWEEGVITIRGEFQRFSYKLVLDPAQDFGLRSYQIFYPADLYDGRLYSELTEVEYRLIGDEMLLPVNGHFRIFAGGESYEEKLIEVLDIATEKPEGIAYSPAMVFPHLTQGVDKRTGMFFRYYADSGEFTSRLEGVEDYDDDEFVRDIELMLATDKLLQEAKNHHASRTDNGGVPNVSSAAMENQDGRRLNSKQWVLVVFAGGVALFAAGFFLRARRRRPRT